MKIKKARAARVITTLAPNPTVTKRYPEAELCDRGAPVPDDINECMVGKEAWAVDEPSEPRNDDETRGSLPVLLDQIPPGTKFQEIDFGPPVGKEIGASDEGKK